jgi:hypothetical protein
MTLLSQIHGDRTTPEFCTTLGSRGSSPNEWSTASRAAMRASSSTKAAFISASVTIPFSADGIHQFRFPSFQHADDTKTAGAKKKVLSFAPASSVRNRSQSACVAKGPICVVE